MIRAVPLEDANAFMLQCSFINGSNAQGCMVKLIDEFGNVTMTGNLTRESGTCAIGILNVTHSSSDVSEVFGYDIESDGSVGLLAVPGVISRNDNETCMTSSDHEVEPAQSEFFKTPTSDDI